MSAPTYDDYIPLNIKLVELTNIYVDIDTGKYWFSSESYDLYGPYDTLEIAESKEKEYFAQL